MTIETTINKIQYTASSGILTYAYTFLVPALTDIVVYVGDSVVSQSNYSVTGLGSASGGNVIFATQPTVGETITIARVVGITQKVDYQPYDPFPAETHEDALDKLTMISQQLDEELGRAIKAPITDDGTTDYTLPLYSAGKAIMWDELTKELTNSNDDLNTLLTNCQAEVDLCEAETAKCVAETAKCVAETAKCVAAQAAAVAAQTAAEAAQTAAETAQTAAELAETNAETAETNAETAETGAVAAQAAAEAAQAAAEAAAAEAQVILTAGATVAWDWAATGGRTRILTITQNTVLSNPTNAVAGMSGTVMVANNASWTLTFGTNYDWGDQSAPVMPAGSGERMLLGFYYDGIKIRSWLSWRSS